MNNADEGVPDPRIVGERVERLLGELHAKGDDQVSEIAEELVRGVVALYGAGLERVMEIAAAGGDGAIVDRLVADPFVESLLLIHDLHPVDIDTRIERALDGVRPYLGSHAGGVQYRGIDESGVVQLTLEGSCNGCPSSTITVQLAIEQAISDAAPETAGVEVVGMVSEPQLPLLQIQPRPPDHPAWKNVGEELGESPAVLDIDGSALLMCRIGDVSYAYRDGCPSCGTSFSGSEQDGGLISCPGCGLRYDVRLAGAGIDDPARHLIPVPLLADDDGGLRIAIRVGAS